MAKRMNAGYRSLAIAVIRRAIVDRKFNWLETEEADFYFSLSGTEINDYQNLINAVKKRKSYKKVLTKENEVV